MNDSNKGLNVPKFTGQYEPPVLLNSNQFKYVPDENYVTLYRVLKARRINDVNPNVLGIHWTADRSVAHEMSDGWEKSVIISAKVHKNDIIDYHSPEGQDYTSKYAIYGPDSPERERTLRPGTELKDVSMTEGNRGRQNRKPPYKYKYVGDSATMRGPYDYDRMRRELRLRYEDLA